MPEAFLVCNRSEPFVMPFRPGVPDKDPAKSSGSYWQDTRWRAARRRAAQYDALKKRHEWSHRVRRGVRYGAEKSIKRLTAMERRHDLDDFMDVNMNYSHHYGEDKWRDDALAEEFGNPPSGRYSSRESANEMFFNYGDYHHYHYKGNSGPWRD
jgi:hypothetical protein